YTNNIITANYLTQAACSFRYGNSIYIFFLTTIRQPPISTLFPYTTLFRSSTNSPTAATTCCTAQADADGAAIKQYKNTASSSTRDRKSTRLNSSHVSISYAVFCLKKKTKDHKKYTKKNDINNNRKI